MSDSVYGPARVFANGLLPGSACGRPSSIRWIGEGRGMAELIEPQTRVIYLESPGSYTFEIQDMPAICALARVARRPDDVDNTYASPCLARPFDWGVDMSLLALTKYWAGHSDLLMGAVVVREVLWPRSGRRSGNSASASAATTPGWCCAACARSTSGCAATRRPALAVARWLQRPARGAAGAAPGTADAPATMRCSRRDFLGSNGLFSFELRPGSTARRSPPVQRPRHFSIGYSWGGFESLIMPALLGSVRTVATLARRAADPVPLRPGGPVPT